MSNLPHCEEHEDSEYPHIDDTSEGEKEVEIAASSTTTLDAKGSQDGDLQSQLDFVVPEQKTGSKERQAEKDSKYLKIRISSLEAVSVREDDF